MGGGPWGPGSIRDGRAAEGGEGPEGLRTIPSPSRAIVLKSSAAVRVGAITLPTPVATLCAAAAAPSQPKFVKSPPSLPQRTFLQGFDSCALRALQGGRLPAAPQAWRAHINLLRATTSSSPSAA